MCVNYFYQAFFKSAGPFGYLDEEQVFVQRIIPETDTIFIRLSSDGKRSPNFLSVIGCYLTLVNIIA